MDRRNSLGKYEVFLVAEPEAVSYETLQHTIGSAIHDREWPTIWVPKPLARAGAWVRDKISSDDDDEPFIKPWMIDMADAHYPVDISHAQRELGWFPVRRLEQVLPLIVQEMLRNPNQWFERNGLDAPAEETAANLQPRSREDEVAS